MRRDYARLAHDVGKYVARTARNLPSDPSPSLVAMLARDLYDLGPGERASTVFARLAADLQAPGLTRARECFGEIDALETNVRAADPAAVRRVAGLACELERILYDLARESA